MPPSSQRPVFDNSLQLIVSPVQTEVPKRPPAASLARGIRSANRAFRCALALCLLLLPDSSAQVLTVGPPNLLWRNKVTGQNMVWLMNRTNFLAELPIQAATDDLNWTIAGTGDFGQSPTNTDLDGEIDIVWQNPVTGDTAVWFMNGTNLAASFRLPSAPELPWRISAVADFDRDGYPDLLWQHLVTAQNAIWFMRGVNRLSTTPMVSAADRAWRVVGAADFDSDPASPSKGVPDLLLRHGITGQNAIWYLHGPKGTNMLKGELFDARVPDQDYRIVGAWDFDGDGLTDVLWHHATLGLNAVWFMSNSVTIGTSYAIRPNYNTNWRLATQDPADSTWNLERVVTPDPKATVHASALRVSLNFDPEPPYTRWDLQRRANTSGWTILQSGLIGLQPAAPPPDTTVQTGNAYDYRLAGKDFFDIPRSTSTWTSAAIALAPVFDRGQILLLVDSALHAHAEARSNLTWSVDRLQQNLVGDGWRILGPHFVPRHDSALSVENAANRANLSNNLELIRTAWRTNADLKGVIIVGHVTIPYSGKNEPRPPDAHTGLDPLAGDPLDHRGAWPADMLYGEMHTNAWDTPALDTSTVINADFPANSNYPNDGKFDPDRNPGDLELFVGRIDFAGLPSFSTGTAPTAAEATLIRQYVVKNENYRKQLAPYPVQEQGIVHGTFGQLTSIDPRNNAVYRNIKFLFQAAFPDSSAKLTVGDPFFRNASNFPGVESTSYLWGFLAGSGFPNSISGGLMSPDWLGHSTAELALAQIYPEREPRIAFYGLLGSYFIDWNMRDNFLRATLATPRYGLASIAADAVGTFSMTSWNFSGFAAGEPLGAALLASANQSQGISAMFAILGDPTLRMHTLRPVSRLFGVSSNGVTTLQWQPSEPATRFYVFGAPDRRGPFTNILGPLSASTCTLTNAGGQYMVRAVQLIQTGRGSSYTNVSQGAFWPP